MKRNTVVFAVSSVLTVASYIAARVLERRQERMHEERMIALDRETQNIREWRETQLEPLIDTLDQKIVNAKFWLQVTEEP